MSKSLEQIRRERNLVAHYESGTSDKVYMACVRWNFESKQWSVLGKWGRRGKKLSSQVKWNGTEYGTALMVQRDLFVSKLKEGYVDVDSASYSGGVSRGSFEIQENMETGDADEKVVAVPKKKAVKESEDEADSRETVAVCTDNKGIEEQFDEGVGYVWERSRSGMVEVYDKTGTKRECFRARFRMVKED